MLIRISDRVRFCYREVVAPGALQAITVDLRVLRANRNRAAPRSAELEKNIVSKRDRPGAAFSALSVTARS
jgi:hypothetical protein